MCHGAANMGDSGDFLFTNSNIMSRLTRKKLGVNRLCLNQSHLLLDNFDNSIKKTYYIDDSEFDYLVEYMRITEMDAITIDVMKSPSISNFKKALALVDKYVAEYYKSKLEY